MWAEITLEAFQRLKAFDTKCQAVENRSLCVKYYYECYGVQLLQITNYLAATNQYYIQDINS